MATPKPRRYLALVALALTGCGKYADDLFCSDAACGWTDAEWARVRSLANPGAPDPDLSNRWGQIPEARILGKQFFFDPAFSGNATQQDAIKRTSPPARAAQGQPINISCATCHDLGHGGVDTSSSPGQVSVGAGWTDVNALGVLNSAYRQVVFWNGRADSLWALNVLVAESGTTLNGNRLRTAHQIATRYASDYQKIFGVPLDVATIAALPADGKPGDAAYDALGTTTQDMVTQILVNWAKAIAAFEAELVIPDSPFDQFVAAGQDSDLISASAKRGARLFVGKAACIDCHAGPQLTDEQFHDIGIPQAGLAVPTTADCPAGNASCDCSDGSAGPCAPWGAWDGLTKLKGSTSKPNKWLRTGRWSDDTSDHSRQPYLDMPVTDALKGAWRTPSLRNVALTAPYMHDGRYATLDDVVWHYNTGGLQAGPEQVGVLAPEIKPLLLTDGEQADLVAFLETLSGPRLDASYVVPPSLPPNTSGGAGGASGTGTAGTTGTGTGGAGGAGGASPTGAAGTGGGAPPPVSCTGAPAPTTITTFSMFQGTDPIFFSGPSEVSGWTFSTTPTGFMQPRLSVGSLGAAPPSLQVMTLAAPASSTGSYVFGLTFGDCLDASAFNGVQFTISSLAMIGCSIQFGVMSRINVASAADPRGICSAVTCDPPLTTITQSGTVKFAFSGGPLPGGPSPLIDAHQIIGVQWRVPVTCAVSLSIDDVRFVSQ